jgi:purine-binding chemotaxis protein CheW
VVRFSYFARRRYSWEFNGVRHPREFQLTAIVSGASAAHREPAHKVLTFSLGAENFGVDILRVQEIRGWSPVTRIPKVPTHVLGVLNLRGAIVPIIDLRIRFGLAQADFTPLTVIIVLSVKSAQGTREFGLVVDGVSDVVDIEAENMKETPSLANNASVDFIQGLAIVADRMLILLDVDELIRVDMEQAEEPKLAGAA